VGVCQRSYLNKKKLKEIYNIKNTNKSEWEIAQEKNYDRIWDCGSLKFELQQIKKL
jgi:hypothetical protein